MHWILSPVVEIFSFSSLIIRIDDDPIELIDLWQKKRDQII